jgi:hypothetical protein
MRARNILLDSRWGVAVPLAPGSKASAFASYPGCDGITPSVCKACARFGQILSGPRG